MNSHIGASPLLMGLLLGTTSHLANAGSIAPDLAGALATRASHAAVPVLVRLSDRVDLGQFVLEDRRQRNGRLFTALKAKAQATQGPLLGFMAERGATSVKALWLVNGLAATVSAAIVKQIADYPGVDVVQLDSSLRRSSSPHRPSPLAPLVPGSQDRPRVPKASPAPEAKLSNPVWNVAAVHAPELWSAGLTGRGVVVANMDTGVDGNHPDLAAKWRGGSNSWFDPHGQHATPYDASGHGTQTMGIMVGGSAGGSTIGVAPDARWIAVKLFDDGGQARLSDIHLAFQWLLDPDGDPATVDAPDVVNASWSLSARVAGSCNLQFNDDISVLRAAGIAVVFAAGNDGPAARTSDSPANNPHGFSVGAVDNRLTVANATSRGPSACDGSIFPTLVAPGVNVRTADLSYGGIASYAVVSGASFAAPHASGVLALLAGAYPAASVEQLEAALINGATLADRTGPNNDYGHGLANAAAAYNALAAREGGGSRTAKPAVGATVIVDTRRADSAQLAHQGGAELDTMRRAPLTAGHDIVR